jgi:uncharacterized SAM-binding protein YcdF (DUF218 family)
LRFKGIGRKFAVFAGGALLINTLLLAITTNFNLGVVIEGLVALAIVGYGVFWERLHRLKALNIAAIAICGVIICFVAFLAIYGTNDNTLGDEDVVIVLGAGVRGESVSLTLARRLDKAADYLAKHERAVVVVSGGMGAQEDITEALAMERYLVDKGISSEKIIKEENSTSTFENLKFTEAILNERFPNGYTAALVTNDFHIYRATKLARLAGISARHISARTEWYIQPACYLREILAVMKMWIFPPNGAAVEMIGE